MSEDELYNSAKQLEREFHTARHGRLKALTVAACVITGVSCLLADWSDQTDYNVFSGIRPVAKRYIAQLYPKAASTADDRN
jgi:hypothetical protein